MEKKWTRGPYIAMAMGSEGYNIYTDDFGKPISQQRFRGALAEVRSGDWKTLSANAKLFAAAPEMYEALLQIRKSLSVDCLIRRDEDGAPFESTVGALKRVEAVLAKARGEGV